MNVRRIRRNDKERRQNVSRLVMEGTTIRINLFKRFRKFRSTKAFLDFDEELACGRWLAFGL